MLDNHVESIRRKSCLATLCSAVVAVACILADVLYNVRRHEKSEADRQQIKAEQKMVRDRQNQIMEAIERIESNQGKR